VALRGSRSWCALGLTVVAPIAVVLPSTRGPTVNLNELAKLLATIGIAPEVLALGGRADYSWCVEETSDGAWEVYWYERGNKNGLVRLDTESEACFQLLGRLSYSQLLAGAIGPR